MRKIIPYSNDFYLKYIATLNNKDYKENLAEMEGKTTSSTGKMEKGFGGVIDKVKGLLSPTNLATAAFVALSYRTVQAVKDFSGFEKQMSKVNTMLGVSRKELVKYGNDIVDIAIKTGVAKEQIAEGAYQALSAGVSSEELINFMEAATKASVAGFSTVETSVDAVTTVLNAYNMASSQATEVTDQLLTIQKNGKTTVAELGQYLAQVIPIASSTGIAFNEVGAAIAQLTASGTPTRVATTQIRQAIAELAKDGTKANLIFQEMAGKTFQDFISSGGTLNEALVLMEKYTVENKTAMLNLWSSVEAGQAALGLTGANAVGFTKNLDEMKDAAGETERAYKLAADNISVEWSRLQEGMRADWKETVGGIIEALHLKEWLKGINDAKDASREYRKEIEAISEAEKAIVKSRLADKGYDVSGGLLEETRKFQTELQKYRKEVDDYYKAYGQYLGAKYKDEIEAEKNIEEGKRTAAENAATLEKTRLDSIVKYKEQYQTNLKTIDLEGLKNQKEYLNNLNSQLESGIITKEEYNKKLQAAETENNIKQQERYLNALQKLQSFYKRVNEIGEANKLEKQILEIEVQISGMKGSAFNAGDTSSSSELLQVEQTKKLEEYQTAQLEKEWSHIQELALQRENGLLSEQEYYARVNEFRTLQGEAEALFREQQQIELRDHYSTIANDMASAAMVQQQIDEARLERMEAVAEAEKEIADKKASDVKSSIATEKSAYQSQYNTAATIGNMLVNMQDATAGEIAAALAIQVATTAGMAAIDAYARYLTDTALIASYGAAYNADGVVKATAAAGLELSTMAQLTALGATKGLLSGLGGMASSSSSSSSSSYDSSTDDIVDSVAKSEAEEKSKMTVYVDSEDLWTVITAGISDYAEDNDIELVVRRG